MNIIGPTLLLDKKKCLQHLRNMQDMAYANNIQLAPHVKTHQSLRIGRWCRKLGISAITVSSLEMAEQFADDGWQDITWAFPVNIRAIEKINQVAEKCSLSLYINELDSAIFLSQHVYSPVNCFIEIDTGYHRSGIDHLNYPRIDALLSIFRKSERIRFRGFYTHAGHSYGARSISEIEAIHEDTRSKLLALKAHYEARHIHAELALGDTPSCSVATQFEGIDIIRPGNFVFYDLMQEQIGSCREEDISVVLAAPIVEIHSERQELIVHAGAVHLSKDRITDENGRVIYGKVVLLEKSGWGKSLSDVYVTSLSQEHGIIRWENPGLEKMKVGDLLGILPVHSCLAANLMRSITTLDGEII